MEAFASESSAFPSISICHMIVDYLLIGYHLLYHHNFRDKSKWSMLPLIMTEIHFEAWRPWCRPGLSLSWNISYIHKCLPRPEIPRITLNMQSRGDIEIHKMLHAYCCCCCCCCCLWAIRDTELTMQRKFSRQPRMDLEGLLTGTTSTTIYTKSHTSQLHVISMILNTSKNKRTNWNLT